MHLLLVLVFLNYDLIIVVLITFNMASSKKGTDKDMKINIAVYWDEARKKDRRIRYNLSSFLDDYDCMGKQWKQNINSFVKDLNDKVKLDINDPAHVQILNGIDSIVGKIATELKKHNALFKHVKTRHSGSLYDNLRVGGPYEADVIFEVPWTENMSIPEDEEAVGQMMVQAASKVREKGWILHGVAQHKSGACLFAQCPGEGGGGGASGGGGTTGLGEGVLIDLIPMLRHQNPLTSQEMSAGARQYLHEHPMGEKAMRRYELFRDIDDYEEEKRFDPGYLEHQILKQLPENLKMGFRVAKYLLQSQIVSPALSAEVEDPEIYTPIESEQILSDAEQADLYGYKPLIKSHILHVLMLKLVLHAGCYIDATDGCYGDAALSLGGLTMCLLDMVATTFSFGEHFLGVTSDIVANQTEEMEYASADVEDVRELRYALLRVASGFLKNVTLGAPALAQYPLLNQPSDDAGLETFARRIDKLEKKAGRALGFCRGLPLEELAALHDCGEEGCDVTGAEAGAPACTQS